MIKLIDKYVIKQFVQTIIFGLITFTLIFVIIDMMENLDDFIDENVRSGIILQYYIVFIPEILRLMLPVSVLLASLFVTGKLSTQNELTAIKAAGVSLYRYMIPFIATSFIISLGAVYFGGFIVPKANKHKIFIERQYLNRNFVALGTDIYFQDSKTRIVSIGSFNTNTNQANRISIQEFNERDFTKMIRRIDAQRMSYDSASHEWILIEGAKRKFNDTKENLEFFSALPIKNLNFSPKDILKKQTKNEEMTLSELNKFASDQLKAGNDPTRILIDYHARFAYGFACVITVLFGLPLSANKRKGGIALQFGINLLVTFIYLFFMNISQAFGKNGVLNPFVTAWMANFIFLGTALIVISRTQK
ncbi:MAG: LPS export ABC transporter permease LptG [Ignavibacteriales bacterium CG_4_9_14_3_um_filter_34_10]|nr:MAG: LPS export ABC transporter permease LptG [Ignavibacteriales bacterium CG_4_9_14_3_um_filter_34_10]